MKRLISIYVCIAGLCYADKSELGKTHFIAGYELQDQKKEQKQIPISKQSEIAVPFNLLCHGQIKAVYFSPDDRISEVLMYLIEQEKKEIKIAMFTFTDKVIAQALVAARSRGVRVELITDSSSVYGKYNKLSLLADGNILLYIYNAQRTSQLQQGLMHNKFFIFQDNILGKSLVWTGSFNATGAAGKVNRENVVVSEEPIFVDKFLKEFERLKKYCDYYQPPVAVNQTVESASKQGQAQKK